MAYEVIFHIFINILHAKRYQGFFFLDRRPVYFLSSIVNEKLYNFLLFPNHHYNQLLPRQEKFKGKCTGFDTCMHTRQPTFSNKISMRLKSVPRNLNLPRGIQGSLCGSGNIGFGEEGHTDDT